MTEDPNDWTYRDALAAAQPRIERLSLSYQAQSDQIQAMVRELGAWIRQVTPEIARLIHLLGLDITVWALAQGPAPELSPALRYCPPQTRRRMAKRRARIVTRCPWSRSRSKGDAHAR